MTKAPCAAATSETVLTAAGQFRTVLIANTMEAFAVILHQSLQGGEGKKRLQQELALSQRAYFWRGDRKAVITPVQIPEPLVDAGQQQLGFESVVNVSPTSFSLELSRVLKEEKHSYKELCELIQTNPGVVLSPYAVTEDFLALVDRLRADGLEFKTPEVPERSCRWLGKYLDSKCGFREAISQAVCRIPEMRFPLGFRCENLSRSIEAIEWFLGRGESCLLKVDVGESGWGLQKFVADPSGSTGARKMVLKMSGEDSIWSHPPFLVEQYISPDRDCGGGSPSVEAYVDENGVELLYTCGQLLSSQGEFRGIVLGPQLLPQDVSTHLERTTQEIGEIFWSLGYRGFFDVDFVVSGDGLVFAVETNTRRTGGTHVFDILAHLSERRKDPPTTAISEDNFVYGNSLLPVDTILNRVKSLLYPISGRPAGAIITLVNSAQPVLGYVLVGSGEPEILALQRDFYDLWKT